jgi:hypothetical protein
MMTTDAMPAADVVAKKLELLHRHLSDRHKLEMQARKNKKTATGNSPITTRPKLRGQA